jgi:phosphatidylglycerol---prolipoprotein diacylglyceryl transferase
MWQTLFHIPLEIGGLPVFGAGVLLVGWMIFSLGLLAWLARRQGFNADTLSYVPILVIVAAVIGWLLPALCDQDGFPIHGYGMMLLMAVLAALGLAVWRGKRLGLEPDLIYSLSLWMILPGIVAARAFYVIEYWDTQYYPVYVEHGAPALLGAVMNIAQGGLVVYGGFLAGVCGLLAFAWKYKLRAFALADLMAPSLLVGLALGRIGCLLNGCCYGGECHLPWAITFSNESFAYLSQVQRGQMYGFRISGDPNAEAMLLAVDADSPAGRAGLKPGQRLEKINGLRVGNAGDAQACLMRGYQRGDELKIQAAGAAAVELPAVEIRHRSLPVHPTQIYSFIDAMLICMLLLAVEPFCRRDGQVFAVGVSLYGVTRFLIEILRCDESPISGTGMTVSQNISLGLLILVVGLWWYILRRPEGKAFSAGAMQTKS